MIHDEPETGTVARPERTAVITQEAHVFVGTLRDNLTLAAPDADAALHGRTGLVIAHRLSQAAVCDRIVVMEHGRIIESGSHEELLAAGGVYAGLWSAWQEGQALTGASSKRLPHHPHRRPHRR